MNWKQWILVFVLMIVLLFASNAIAQTDININDTNLIRFGGDVTVQEKQVVENAHAIGGSVIVQPKGRVTQTAIAVGGNVTLKKGARVDGDAYAIGGKVIQEEGATIGGATTTWTEDGRMGMHRDRNGFLPMYLFHASFRIFSAIVAAILAPVERQWDSDIADLLELTLEHVDFEYRQQEIARLNQYRPPAVSEWRSLETVMPPDVENPDAVLDRYRGFYAEQLAALLHKEVPQVMDCSPESLPTIDYHFWQFDYPGTLKREDIENDLVPAIGAYLGEVIVRHLGGQWVPRQTIDESQVVVGTRAWLPFLRARHYMQTKQAALDYSLTQFYRVAQRFQSN